MKNKIYKLRFGGTMDKDIEQFDKDELDLADLEDLIDTIDDILDETDLEGENND